MLFLLYYLIGWIAGILAIIIDPSITGLAKIAATLLMYQLVFTVGLTGILAGYGHLFRTEEVANQIGWPAAGPFQIELGFSYLGMGLLGVLSFWYQQDFWLATTIFSTIFLLSSAAIHLRDMASRDELNLRNAVSSLPNILIPITLIVLWVISI